MRQQWRWHKDWRVWTMIVLMLIACATYLMTLDDSTVVPLISQGK